MNNTKTVTMAKNIPKKSVFTSKVSFRSKANPKAINQRQKKSIDESSVIRYG